ncbi:hypothetical protein AKJ16_DCAP09035 [Drosera capensis]
MASTASTSDLPATDSAAADGPVLNLINKRIRALRKKLNRIHQTEDSLSLGKPLNSEQQDLLRSKPSVLALLDELEKLKSPLSLALRDEIEIELAKNKTQQHDSDDKRHEESEDDKKGKGGDEERDDVVMDVVDLLYFGSLFDVMPQSEFTSMMLTRSHERGCCLTYDYVTDDDATDVLGERDLDLIAGLKGLLVSRPMDSSLSHKDALRRCVEHAKLWVQRADRPIAPDSDITYARLREKLDKIMSSDYYTTTPEMKAAVEMAAAAAAGNFGAFQVGGHGSMMPVSAPVQVDESTGHYQDMEENIVHYEDYETMEHQSDPVHELPKDNLETEKPLLELPTQSDQMKQQADLEDGLRDMELREQHASRRAYQNQRGGRGSINGRRGYTNGRGGRGAYQNGRNQYYDQGSNYYPRNYYNNRGRGGRSAGGNNYYHHGSSVNDAGHAHEDGGVVS